MFQILFSSILMFIATECDDFLIYVILFTNYGKRKMHAAIIAGQVTALVVITSLCAFAAFFLSKIPANLIGFSGLIPVLFGIKEIIKGSSDEIHTDVEKNLSAPPLRLFTLAFSVTAAASGDNACVYIPYFASISLPSKVLIILFFIFLQIIWSALQIKASRISFIHETVSAASRWLIPLLLITLGAWIILKNNTFYYALYMIRLYLL